MSHLFKIGDRVRIKYSVGCPALAGKQGTVIGHQGTYRNKEGRLFIDALIVAPDSWGSENSPDGSHRFCPAPDQLEPLQKPDTYTVTTWEQVPFGHPAKYLEGVAA